MNEIEMIDLTGGSSTPPPSPPPSARCSQGKTERGYEYESPNTRRRKKMKK